jgi:hypothetical protein
VAFHGTRAVAILQFGTLFNVLLQANLRRFPFQSWEHAVCKAEPEHRAFFPKTAINRLIG